jgi:hypothetical protein
MLKFTSVSDSDRAITDTTLGTTTRTGITRDLIIIGRTTGMADIVIIATIIIILISGTSLTGIATTAWLEAFEPGLIFKRSLNRSGRREALPT